MAIKGPSTSDAKVEALTQALTAGHYLDRACKIAGISRSTVYRWLDIAAEAEESESPDPERQPYLEVAEAIRKAREAAAHRAMISIQNAVAEGTWQAAAWYLERTDREHYGRYTQVAGSDGGAVKLNVTVEDMEKVLKELIDQETANADNAV